MTNEEKILEMLGTINDRLGRLETTQDKMQAAQDKMQAAQDKMQKDMDTVKTTQAQMQATQDKMEMDLTRVRVTLEVEVDRDIKLLAEGHAGIIEKLGELDEMKESLEETRVKVDAIHAVTKENIREIKVLKRSRS